MNKLIGISLVLLASAFIGCSNKTEAEKELDKHIEATKDAIDDNADKAKAELDAQRNEYDAQVQQHMTAMKAYLDSLEAAYASAKGTMKEKYRKQIESLKVRRDTIVIGYERVRTAPPSDYARLRNWYDSVSRANDFWSPNSNSRTSGRTAGRGVELEPNKN